MFLRLFFTLFAVSSGLCANAPIDPDIFRDVFGYPAVGAQAEASSTVAHTSRPFVQVSPITPDNETLVDHDYWDLPEEFTPAAADYDKFDWVLTKRVAASSEENFLLSPLGLKLALAILYEAATGATQAELASVLGFDLDRHDVRRKFSNILGSLQTQSSQYILNLGNRIYVEDSAEPRQRFSAIAEEFYKTELRKVDFNSPAVAARDINSWVYNKTEGKIPKLVNEDDIAGLVVLILNTLYFKGTWRHQFVPSLTNVAPFYVSPTVQKQIPFMNVKNKFFYNESTQFDAKILRMPYLGNKFSMYIIVPNSLTGLPRIFNRLTELRAELLNLREYSVNVTIPKFQFEYTSLLDGILKELGIRQAFEDTASFPGIARGQRLQDRLRVSKVLQRSGIEVNELGSVAYSATEVSLENKFGENNFVLVANKPFLFFIEDEATRQLLFTGRVSDPSLSDGAFKLT